ncbi:hypothetical protein HAX54_006506 [Datura stramonium]|uniref:Uncharacterized protein n=1 Tax=Datura stramonium TaxID=4076 RepID=A0ABS8TB98_DATST|nr:hypothetical protein [Datura stramonium]
MLKLDDPRQGCITATIAEAFCLEWNLCCILVKEGLVAHLDSSEGARYVRGMELRLRDSLRAMLRIIIWHPSSSETPRQVRGTELVLRDTLSATLPVYFGKFLTRINNTLRFYFKISDMSS